MPTEKRLLDFSKKLRKAANPYEDRLWFYLRGRRFLNLKFKRQVVIDKYIVDFCCLEKKLIIELDGGQHSESQEYDLERDRNLALLGYTVLRFWNSDLQNNVDGVLEKIRVSLADLTRPPATLS